MCNSDTLGAEKTLQRFWKNVNVKSTEEGHLVTLDNRPLKTPAGMKLVIPIERKILASLIASEWDLQDKALKAHSLPLTSLASRAIDTFASTEPAEEISGLLKYLDTDAVCYYADHPESLVELQHQHWDPIIAWIKKTYDVKIDTTTSIGGIKQPEATREKLGNVIQSWTKSPLGAIKLAAFERAVMFTKSFLLSLAFVEGHLTVEEASEAARVEVLDQISRWGEVEDTHDVDYQDIRKQLGSVAVALM